MRSLVAIMLFVVMLFASGIAADAKAVFLERGAGGPEPSYHLTVDMGKVNIKPSGITGTLLLLFPPEVQVESMITKHRGIVHIMAYTTLDDAVGYRFGLRPGLGLALGEGIFLRPAVEMSVGRLDLRGGLTIGKGFDFLGRFRMAEIGNASFSFGYYSGPDRGTVTFGLGYRF